MKRSAPHVLVLEPDVILGQLMADALKGRGCSVSWNKTAESAVHDADEQRPDIVIIELQLPKHNGIEFLYEFKSYSEWMDVPVVVYTHMLPTEIASVYKVATNLGIMKVYQKSHCSIEQLCDSVLEMAATHAAS